MTWFYFIFLAATMWSLHNIAIKILGEHLPAAFIATLFYSIAFTTTLLLYWFTERGHEKVDWSLLGQPKIFFAIVAAGITIGLTDFFFVSGLARGAPLSLANPTFSTIGLILTVIAGLLLFQEVLTPAKILGMFLAVVSIFLLLR